jgi:hypothetical protein
MTFEEFDRFTEGLFEDVMKMRDTKGKEHANSADRFGNFNRLASRLDMPREKVLLVYLTKHMDSIDSYVVNSKTFSTETIRGRIVDAITYLTLLAGMIQEKDSA